MKNRFDLEDEITQLYLFIDILEDIKDAISKHKVSKKETINAIGGLSVLYKIYANKLYDTFIQSFNLNEYNK